MRISDWSSDVCSSDLGVRRVGRVAARAVLPARRQRRRGAPGAGGRTWDRGVPSPCRAPCCGLASRAEGGGAGDGSVRDAAGPSAADRIRRAAGVEDRESVVEGKRGLVRVGIGGRRIIKKKTKKQ